MAKGELYIKTSATKSPERSTDMLAKKGWVDAYDTWGVSFTDASLSALMTPAPMKAPVENKSRLEHGKRVITNETYSRQDERDVTLEMHITAADKTEFWQRYDSFCSLVLERQFILLKSGYRKDKVFHMSYESCTQFSEFAQEVAKFSLRLNEPDPSNRTEVSND